MNICIGDLVTISKKKEYPILGIVIEKHNSNQGIQKSIHTTHLVKSYPPIFYVYSLGLNHGPFLRSDLSLQQSYNTSR